jgi:hypothetical protein
MYLKLKGVLLLSLRPILSIVNISYTNPLPLCGAGQNGHRAKRRRQPNETGESVAPSRVIDSAITQPHCRGCGKF